MQPTAQLTPLVRLVGLQVQLGGRMILQPVDLQVQAGERLAVVGGSGSGKTTLARALAALHPAGAVTAQQAWVGDVDLTQPVPARFRGGVVGYAFQDALATLDPLQRIGSALREVVRTHQPDLDPSRTAASCVALLAQAGLPHPEHVVDRYPHQLSGGQRQRVGLALALAGRPRLLVADEPTSSLDPPLSRSIARQLLGLSHATDNEPSMALILITHDLQLARAIAQHIVVLGAGQVVERGPIETVLQAPQHPATQVLLRASGLLD